MKRFVKIMGVYLLCFWTLTFAQTLDQGDLAQALRKTITLGQGLSQWQDLPQYPITLSNTAEPTPVTSPGYYSVAWDNANLYILAVLEQPQETLLADLPTDAPEWWTGDTLEIFIRPAAGAEKLHFATSPSGTPFAASTSSVNYQTSSLVEETRWILELAIPLNDVLPALTTGDVWQFKVGRGYLTANEYSLWPNGGDFQAEDNFGGLYFGVALENPEALYTRLAPRLE
jgi:Carbohydrate family 9 binding domain-like